MGLLTAPLIWLAMAAGGVMLVIPPGGGNADLHRRLLAVALRMLRWGLLPAAVILSAPGIGDDMRTALIAALLVVAGWFATFLFQQEERAADQIDLMIAMRAEVWVFLNDLRRNAAADPARATLAELAAAEAKGAPVAPFFPQPGPALVFEVNASQVARLPSDVVDEVVQFYSLLGAVRQFALELREPVFLARPLPVRRQAYLTYFKSYADLGDLANAAVIALNRGIGVPNPEATGLPPATAAGVSRPDQARSDLPEAVSDVSDRKP